MLNLYHVERKKIDIGENCFLTISFRQEGYYTWNAVFFETLDEKIKIGTYSTIPDSLEGMCYNENCVALVVLDRRTKQIMINRIFDIASRQILEGTQATLQEYYRKEFGSNNPVKVYKKH